MDGTRVCHLKNNAKPENLACHGLSPVILFIQSNIKEPLNSFISVVFVIHIHLVMQLIRFSLSHGRKKPKY